MKNNKAIVLAMASGAAANFRPNPFYRERPVEAAYLALRRFLADHYPAVTNDILDIGPASAERQAILERQLRDSGAAADPKVRASAGRLARLILRKNPDAAPAVFADINNLHEAATVLNN